MGLFRKLGLAPPPPWWHHTNAEWKEFIAIVRTEMASRDIAITEDLEEGHIVFNKGMHIGLHNVSARWPQIPREDRRKHVSGFLDDVLRAATDEAPVEADRLRATIHPNDMPLDEETFVRKRLCDSFSLQVMFDRANSARAVRHDDIASIGLSADEAFALSVENVWRSEPHNVDRHQVKDLGQLTMVHGDSMYSAANVLLLDRFINPLSERGVVIAVPNRHMFAFVRTDEPRFQELLAPLAHFARGESTGDYPVTADLVWWSDRQFKTVGWPTATGYEIALPPELRG